MLNVQNLISPLPSEHQQALSWFVTNSGKDNVPYTPKFNDITIVSPAQGIYKPKTSDYALSVKETLKGFYPDQKPVFFENGSWLYAYHQQGDNSETDRDKLSANRALLENIKDKVPVGVWLQTQSKGRKGTKYKIGIALPIAWKEGFFILAGASPQGEISNQLASARESFNFIFKGNQEHIVEEEGFFSPKDIVDARKKSLKSIVQRQGQPGFRKKVLRAYDGKCPITECEIEEALEASHISPYMGPSTNHVQNGLPLRGDIHTLWDLGYLYVDPSNMEIRVHPKLLSSEYRHLNGKKLISPVNAGDRPSLEALNEHLDFCNF